jgi:error-prone DNA polymerase
VPENEFPKLRPHPFKAALAASGTGQPRAADQWHPHPDYAELCVTSNFTFLTGASHPDEFVVQAASLGYRAIAVTDTLTLAGVVRAHVAAKGVGIPFILGSRLRFTDAPGLSVFAYPTDMDSYRGLCRLLTIGKRRAPKGECHLAFDDLAPHAAGLIVIADAEDPVASRFTEQLRLLRELFDDDRLSLTAAFRYGPDDAARLRTLADLSERLHIPLVATSDAHYHHPDRRMLQDVLTCIRHKCTLAEAGFRLHANAERYLKPVEEMRRLFGGLPGSLRRTVEIAERTAGFGLDQLRYEYPDEVVPPGKTPQEHLTDLAWAGAAERYPGGVPERVRAQIGHELRLIEELNYATYFLTVHDLVRFARSGEEHSGDTPPPGWAPILCQGRGAAANSAVCYCLGVTSVDPDRIDVLFERFVSKERNEPPDIDIDFEHERREEVIQYLYRKYGRDRAALTAEVISYRRRSAVRDIGKALGLSLDLVDRLAKDIDWWDQGTLDPTRLRELGLNPSDPTVKWLATLIGDILGFPRHLSQHVGGFVITRTPLSELVPIENAAMPDRTVVEWDKDDIDAVGMLKVDVLGLGMLTALRRCMDFVSARRSEPITLVTIPPEDPVTYEMIQRADTIGVFQIESRAQMSMLPRLKPKEFYDLVIEVAIVRPGPIQGDMVHPYLRRRSGLEKVEYVHPAVEEVLKKTLGVPLFQEQCMALAVKAAGFTPGQADQLRRAMAAWKRKGDQIYRFGKQLIEGMVARAIPRDFAERCFEQIKGFSEYGFPESHAASFALLVYASAWLKCHHPAEFCAALLNSQPMGFYAPAQLVRDAREHGATVRPVDVNQSAWDCSIEDDGAVRLGMRMVSGIGQPDADKIAAAVAQHGPARSIVELWRRSGAKASTLRRLAAADAFTSMGLARQAALWDARLLRDAPLPLFESHEPAEPEPALPPLDLRRHVVLDYSSTGLSLRAHPVSFARQRLAQLGVVPCSDLSDAAKSPNGEWVRVAGLVLVRQRPGTASGVTFMTLEDETGIANLVVWRQVYDRYRRAAASGLLIAHGRIQRQDGVVHVVAERLRGLDAELQGLEADSRDFR